MSEQLVSAAGQLSSMADKVAGFAISSDLVLIFACMKEVGPWVQKQMGGILIGTAVAGAAYILAVWCLHCLELKVLDKAQLSGDLTLLTSVSWWLAGARSLGIAAFTLIGMGAVWGASKGS
jgi:hypothetical protein